MIEMKSELIIMKLNRELLVLLFFLLVLLESLVFSLQELLVQFDIINAILNVSLLPH